MGYKNVSPAYNDERTDIIQTLELGSKENLVSFTQGIQSTSPIDSFVRVMAAPMPGYPFDEVMAAGSFTQGSTIELSAFQTICNDNGIVALFYATIVESLQIDSNDTIINIRMW